MEQKEFEKKYQDALKYLDKKAIYGEGLERFLNEIYDSNLFEDYCSNGLQIQGDKKIKKIITAVSGSLETIERSIEMGADALIVHHGIFWFHQKTVLTGAMYKKIKAIMDSGIHLLAYHLPMDGHRVLGNGACLARDLGVEDIEPFARFRGNAVGVKGLFKKKVSIQDLEKKIKSRIKKEILLFGKGPNLLSKAAVVTGGGQREFRAAIDERDIDVFITGEVSENNYHQAREEGIWFAACGHHATEKFGPQALARFLSGLNIFDKARFLDVPNPV